MKCSDCKHWERYTDKSIIKSRGEHSGECDSDKFVNLEWADKSITDQLMYWDYESYAAGFFTGENFGCIHFEVRE